MSVEHDHDFCAKTTEAIEMQFTAFTRVDPCNRVFSGGPDYLRGRGVFFGEGDFPVHKKLIMKSKCPTYKISYDNIMIILR